MVQGAYLQPASVCLNPDRPHPAHLVFPKCLLQSSLARSRRMSWLIT